MNRRQLIQTGALFGATMALPKLARAQSAEPVAGRQIELSTVIGSNHRHALELTAADALQMMRDTQGGERQSVNIQGQSSHPHTISLSHEEILQLFIAGQLTLTSTEDFGHAHELQLTLNIV